MNEKTKMIIEEYAAAQTQTAEALLMELGKNPGPPVTRKTNVPYSAGTGFSPREPKMLRLTLLKMWCVKLVLKKIRILLYLWHIWISYFLTLNL